MTQSNKQLDTQPDSQPAYALPPLQDLSAAQLSTSTEPLVPGIYIRERFVKSNTATGHATRPPSLADLGAMAPKSAAPKPAQKSILPPPIRFSEKFAPRATAAATVPEEQDLDLLWGTEPVKNYKEERSAATFFLMGLLLGALLMMGVDNFLLRRPEPAVVPTAADNVLTAPMPDAEISKTKQALNPILKALQNAAKSSQSAQAPVPTAPVGTTYAVVSGDTLGRIAGKFYGNTGPEAVARICKANQLTETSILNIGQTLVIPSVAPTP